MRDNLKRYKKIKKENNQKISDNENNKLHIKLQIQNLEVKQKGEIK
jgi:hypothetical protein